MWIVFAIIVGIISYLIINNRRWWKKQIRRKIPDKEMLDVLIDQAKITEDRFFGFIVGYVVVLYRQRVSGINLCRSAWGGWEEQNNVFSIAESTYLAKKAKKKLLKVKREERERQRENIQKLRKEFAKLKDIK